MNHKDDEYVLNEAANRYEDAGTYDAGPYNSAAGWPSPEKIKKLREAYKKKHPELHCMGSSMLKTESANNWLQTEAANKPQTDLFGGLWKTGELAILFGEAGTGKSILAMQIAESIARGRPAMSVPGAVATGDLAPKVPPASRRLPTGIPVLYFDLERSDAQLKARYSCPSPIPGKLPLRYRFSSKLRQTRIGSFDIPEAFNDDLARYFVHSLGNTFEQEAANVCVIDSLAWLDLRAKGAAECIRRMRSLKLFAAKYHLATLVVAHAKGSKFSKLRPIELNDVAPREEIARIADSVFAIGQSTLGPDIRYVKHLKSNSAPVIHGASNVLVYQLGRSEGPARNSSPARVSSPHVSKGQPTIVQPDIHPESPFLIPPNSQLPTPHSQIPDGPFLGFQYLGVATEASLLRDHEREYRQAEAREQKRLAKLRNPRNAVDMFLSPEYQRYIEP